MQPAYSVERVYAYPLEKLWLPWTQAAALQSWYHGVEHRCAKLCDRRRGSRRDLVRRD
jgi:uncharacterized protein YndB with AHSA1/START domain